MFYNNDSPEPADLERGPNVEKRREKSKNAARSRRETEGDVYNSLYELVPVVEEPTISHVDRIAVLRLVSSYLGARRLSDKFFPCHIRTSNNFPGPSYVESQLCDATDGFLIILDSIGGIFYISEGVSRTLGLTQTDLIGESLLDYVHQGDEEQVKDILERISDESTAAALDRGDRGQCCLWDSIQLRVKSVLTPRGRQLSLRSATHKVISFTVSMFCCSKEEMSNGQKPVSLRGCQNHRRTGAGKVPRLNVPSIKASQSRYLLMYAMPLYSASATEKLKERKRYLVTTRHSMDMKFNYIDERMADVIGYDVPGLIGRSLFEFMHADDVKSVADCVKTLRNLGQAVFGFYRMLVSGGGYVWTYTEASVVSHNTKGHKTDYIVCLHQIVDRNSCMDKFRNRTMLASLQNSEFSRKADYISAKSPLIDDISVTGSLSRCSSVCGGDSERLQLLKSTVDAVIVDISAAAELKQGQPHPPICPKSPLTPKRPKSVLGTTTSKKLPMKPIFPGSEPVSIESGMVSNKGAYQFDVGVVKYEELSPPTSPPLLRDPAIAAWDMRNCHQQAAAIAEMPFENPFSPSVALQASSFTACNCMPSSSGIIPGGETAWVNVKPDPGFMDSEDMEFIAPYTDHNTTLPVDVDIEHLDPSIWEVLDQFLAEESSGVVPKLPSPRSNHTKHPSGNNTIQQQRSPSFEQSTMEYGLTGHYRHFISQCNYDRNSTGFAGCSATQAPPIVETSLSSEDILWIAKQLDGGDEYKQQPSASGFSGVPSPNMRTNGYVTQSHSQFTYDSQSSGSNSNRYCQQLPLQQLNPQEPTPTPSVPQYHHPHLPVIQIKTEMDTVSQLQDAEQFSAAFSTSSGYLSPRPPSAGGGPGTVYSGVADTYPGAPDSYASGVVLGSPNGLPRLAAPRGVQARLQAKRPIRNGPMQTTTEPHLHQPGKFRSSASMALAQKIRSNHCRSRPDEPHHPEQSRDHTQSQGIGDDPQLSYTAPGPGPRNGSWPFRQTMIQGCCN